jgi:hypothetical protein
MNINYWHKVSCCRVINRANHMFDTHISIQVVIAGVIRIREYGLENRLLKFVFNQSLRYFNTFHRLRGLEQVFMTVRDVTCVRIWKKSNVTPSYNGTPEFDCRDWWRDSRTKQLSMATTICSAIHTNSTKIRIWIVTTISPFIRRNLHILSEKSKERKNVMWYL